MNSFIFFQLVFSNPFILPYKWYIYFFILKLVLILQIKHTYAYTRMRARTHTYRVLTTSSVILAYLKSVCTVFPARKKMCTGLENRLQGTFHPRLSEMYSFIFESDQNQNRFLKENQNKIANSVDPDETAHYGKDRKQIGFDCRVERVDSNIVYRIYPKYWNTSPNLS